jgi:hypothetical protein
MQVGLLKSALKVLPAFWRQLYTKKILCAQRNLVTAILVLIVS